MTLHQHPDANGKSSHPCSPHAQTGPSLLLLPSHSFDTQTGPSLLPSHSFDSHGRLHAPIAPLSSLVSLFYLVSELYRFHHPAPDPSPTMARGPAKSATTVRPTCIKPDSFFARPPHKWNLREFVAFQYPRCKLQSDPKRRILGAWTGALGKIGICRNYKCRGNSQHRRAAELLMAYHTTVRFNVL
jgi:hypothetical protein